MTTKNKGLLAVALAAAVVLASSAAHAWMYIPIPVCHYEWICNAFGCWSYPVCY